MRIINDISNQRFTLDGIEYLKNFLSRPYGNKITIYNAYDFNDVLIENELYTNVEVNGVVYGSAALLQQALLSVIYTRNSLGGIVQDSPYFNYFNNIEGFNLVGQDLTLYANWAWTIQGGSHTNASDIILNVPYAATGYHRIDIVVANTLDTFELIQGVEVLLANSPAEPSTPIGTLKVTSLSVTEGTISDPDTPTAGTDFVKKQYSLSYSYSTGTTNAVYPLRDNGASVYTLTNSGLISVSGFDLSLIVGSAEIPYSGKTIRIINQTGSDITLKHYDDTNAELPLFLKGGTDLFMPHNETIEFYYSPTELTEVFKSWGGNTDLTIVRDKFTFSVSQSFTLTNLPTKILFVTVNGQILDETQYNLASDEITILDTLDSGDVVLVVYDLSSHVYVEDNVALIKDNFVFVDKSEDLANPISTVYNLEDNTAYYFTKSVDLLGGRLVCGQNTVILGSSSENVTLSSTGLIGTALITSNYSLPIRNITITADVALNLNGDGTTTALDWFGVNFKDCNNVGTIQNYTNHVWTDCAFLESGNLTYDGTIDSVAINSCLFNTASGQTAIAIASTCTLSRRFRIIYSAFIVLSGETGINFSTSATVPVEAYILDTVNFTGGGIYTTGVTFSDNKAKFTNSVGVSNSNETAQYYMNGNATTTTITAINTPVKISGTTTNSSITQRFTHTDNRATYVGAIARVFKISVTVTLTGAVNHQIGCYIAKNGTVINESEMYVTTNGSGRAENAPLQTLVSMSNGDYIEIFTEDNTVPATDILVQDLNVIIQ
jgi:hypothetical protein